VPRLIFGGPPKMSAANFPFIHFWYLKFRRVSHIFGLTLIGHQFQSFGARKKFFWIWAPYICIIAYVKKNLDQTLRSGFSIGVVESTPTPGHPEISDAGSNRVKSIRVCLYSCMVLYYITLRMLTKYRYMPIF
jgi:hypothetical protein